MVKLTKDGAGHFLYGGTGRVRSNWNHYLRARRGHYVHGHPWTPSPEVCDGFDNDCDGLIDGADPSLLPSINCPSPITIMLMPPAAWNMQTIRV